MLPAIRSFRDAWMTISRKLESNPVYWLFLLASLVAASSISVKSSAASPEPQSGMTSQSPLSAVDSTYSAESHQIIVDHNSIDLFEQIPDEYIQSAASMAMLFMDRSVGENIDFGLECLLSDSDELAPNYCSRYVHVDPTYSVDPGVVSWYRDGGFDRTNWEYAPWPDGQDCSSWSQKVDCFINYIEPQINTYDVVSFQFSYLLVNENSTIADQPGGYFWDNPYLTDVYDFEAFETRNPDIKTIYWTTSLSRGIGTSVSETFNNQMRQYALENGKILFDVADILSHDPDGLPCFDNRDGIPYDNGNTSENHPDDGMNIPAICQHYTTEVDGGHLGSVSAGMIRVSKAFWVLMAQIAGWTPNPDFYIYLPMIQR